MNIANMSRVNHDYLYLINSMFSCLYLISTHKEKCNTNSFTGVTCHMAVELLVSSKPDLIGVAIIITPTNHTHSFIQAKTKQCFFYQMNQ